MNASQGSPPMIPRSLARLTELSQNLWWSWTVEARQLFEAIDPTLWYLTQHNPVKMLSDVKPERLIKLGDDPSYLRQYSAVIKLFDEYRANGRSWFGTQHKPSLHNTIAYFSAEFGLHTSIPIYSGGLGILAGDHCKEASDLGIPLVGIGFMYPQGYFRQRITAEGWQEAAYSAFNREDSPIHPALTPSGEPCRITVEMGGRIVAAVVWKVQVGRVPLYLIDTDVPENSPENRALSARLYGGDQEMRLCQEILLGIGGVRVLRALGIDPSVWHANEGHSAFLTLERLREFVEKGCSHAEASEQVRMSTVFTTHTPVPAGHDVFPHHLMDRYFDGFWDLIGLSREEFLRLGETPESSGNGFNMTALVIRLSAHINGVSREHGRVSRSMWEHFWPGLPTEEVPIRSITNGVHAPTWISPELNRLYCKSLSPTWSESCDDPALWQRVMDIPDDELWAMRQTMKRKLMGFVRERARSGWISGALQPSQVLTRGTLLDPEALTIGFARRFATYKRATLLFRDLERLKRLLQDTWRPVQLIFAGKAHPADEPGRFFIHEVLNFCHDHKLGGQIAFLEDYEMHMAKYLVQGVDVWLNTPRYPMEASGTSGMKAALNGAVNLSILDGWWQEGYNGANGWGIQPLIDNPDVQAQDQHDAEQLYRILEHEVVPLFYQRDLDGIPRGWLQLVKESIRTVAPTFCTKRMVKDYVEILYTPAMVHAPSSW
ncbi:putative glycogen phosphorylase [Nitrospira sp. KM1]|uniref:alpha-glucan family phosphorylase n=1 Tax=Nitrospira sp. KM1 TaxID=1936990 RepID=UPI0013A78608|nr:alpha-glucan family phosphorylase [Nitrospira sp. KM1]BCA56708.1 putative glycogen phosphorylase [Nitrospira sp. KM1]